MWTLFRISNFLVVLFCFLQVHASKKFIARHETISNKKHNSESLNSPLNHLRSIIETQRLSLDIPMLKSEFESIEDEDDKPLNGETDLMNPEFCSQSINDFIAEVNQTLNLFKKQFEQQNEQNEILKSILVQKQNEQNELLKVNLEQVLKKQNNLEIYLQSHEETLKSISKDSTDHNHIHDAHLNCLGNCTPSVESPEAVCSKMNQDAAFVFKIPNRDLKAFYAYCRRFEDNSSWIVIQRREDGSVNFNRGWNDYKHGFGDVYGEYWIGLERLHALTISRAYELKIYLEDYANSQRTAKYTKFFVGSEDEDFLLTIGAYSGNAGDSLSPHNSLKFTTYDRTNFNSEWNCAQKYKGGWWYDKCYASNLNGQYFSITDRITFGGIRWNGWKLESLKRVMMLMRPL